MCNIQFERQCFQWDELKPFPTWNKGSSARRKVNKDQKLTPHTVSPRLPVPANIQKPPYVDTGETPWGKEPAIHDAEVSLAAATLLNRAHMGFLRVANPTDLYSVPQGVERMRAACKLAAEVLNYAETFVKVSSTASRLQHALSVDLLSAI